MGEAALRCFDELDHAQKAGVAAIFLIGEQGGDALFNVAALFEEELFVALLHGTAILFGESATGHANQVDTTNGSGATFSNGEGGDILHNAGAATNHGVLTHAHKLVQGSKARDDGVVANLAVTRNTGVAAEDAVVANDALMPTVGVDEEVVVAANDGLGVGRGGAVDVAVFAEDVVVTYLQEGGLALVLQILGLKTNDREGEELVTLAKGRWTIQDNMAVQDTPSTQFDVFTNDAVGSDFDIVG